MLSTNPVTANLIRARELIADEKNWSCEGTGDCRNTFCAMAALGASARRGAFSDAYDLLRKAAAPESVVGVNDRLGHAATMRMFDRAIELSLVSS